MFRIRGMSKNMIVATLMATHDAYYGSTQQLSFQGLLCNGITFSLFASNFKSLQVFIESLQVYFPPLNRQHFVKFCVFHRNWIFFLSLTHTRSHPHTLSLTCSLSLSVSRPIAFLSSCHINCIGTQEFVTHELNANKRAQCPKMGYPCSLHK